MDEAALQGVEPGPSGPTEAAQKAAVAASVAFAKRRNRGNIRKRPAADDVDDDQQDEANAVVRKAQVQKDNPLAFTTKKDDKFQTFKYESSRNIQQQTDMGATKEVETETQHDRDGRALREKRLKAGAEEAATDGTYKGMAAYNDYRAGFRRENTVGGDKSLGAFGPLRGSSNVRMTIRIDYQPDICKDYKETGYCGYGDNCKFMHDRGDYKSGWEIDREWEDQQKAKKKALQDWDPDKEPGEEQSEEEEDDGLPFACFICRRPWDEASEPVVTKCKHYFCEHCALKHNSKSGKCFVCEQPTQGIFNVAHDIVKKVKAQSKA